MGFPDFFIWDRHERGILDFVDAVVADHGRPSPLRDEEDVEALQEPDKT
jgi:hypothetical protein